MKKKLLSHQAVNPKIPQNTYKALKKLIINSYLSQLSLSNESKEIMDIKSMWKEYCTVKLCSSRQAGHSTAICKAAYKLFNRALILSPNKSLSLRLRQSFPMIVENNLIFEYSSNSYISINGESEYYFETFQDLSGLDKLRGFDVEAVFVDCSFVLSKDNINNIYDTLGPSMSKYSQNFFIFVQ